MTENITYPHMRVVMIDFWEQDRSISTPLSIVINTVHPWAKGLIKTSTSWELALKNLLFKRQLKMFVNWKCWSQLWKEYFWILLSCATRLRCRKKFAMCSEQHLSLHVHCWGSEIIVLHVIFKRLLGDDMLYSFHEDTDTLFWTSDYICTGFQSQCDLPLARFIIRVLTYSRGLL